MDAELTEALAANNVGELLTEPFFDKLHNSKRRDTRNVKQNYKNAVKTALLEKAANITDIDTLVKFHKAVDALKDDPKQNHFLKRFKGIGRDMRIEDLANRIVGATFLDDEKDGQFAAGLQKFENENRLITEVNRLDYELAECAVPPPSPIR